MFAFAGHPGVEPTNNAPERALGYHVMPRKVIGQARGGVRAMRLVTLSAARGGMGARTPRGRSEGFRKVGPYGVWYAILKSQNSPV